MTYKSIKAIEKKNREAGGFFFDRANVAHMKSRIESIVLFGRFFLTSEIDTSSDESHDRKFTVRQADDEGHIRTVGNVREFSTRDEAIHRVCSLNSN